MDATSTAKRSGGRSAWAAAPGALVAIAAVGALVYAWWPPAPPPPKPLVIVGPELPAPSGATALLEGLAAEQSLGEWEVVSIGMPREGDMLRSIAIRLRRGRDAFFTVWIARDGTFAFLPRAETKLYDLYYGAFDPPKQRTPPEAFTVAVEAIAERIKRREETVPVPEGL